MDISSVNDILKYSGIIPILFGLFFIVQLKVSSIGKERSNRLIANYFIVAVVALICKYMIQISLDWPLTYLLFFPALLLLAPALYRYLYFLLKENVARDRFKNAWMHLLIPGIYLFVGVFTYITSAIMPEENTIRVLSFHLFNFLMVDAFTLVFSIQNIIYLTLFLRNYREYQSSIGQYSAFQEGLELKWVKTLVISYLVTILIYAISKLLLAGLPLFYPIALIHLLYIGFYVIHQNFKLYKTSVKAELVAELNQDKPASQSNPDLEEQKKKYEGSSLKESQKIDDLKQRILDFVEKEKPYLDPDVSIYKLGKALDVNSKYISQVINQEMNMNFIRFINQYRIEEVKRLMRTEEANKFTLESLAQQAGFKSKSTFNNSFKKAEGVTPSVYRKSLISE